MKSISLRFLFAALLVLVAGCSSSSARPAPGPSYVWPQLQPGEVCDPTNSTTPSIRFDPPALILAPNQTRSVTAFVEPDLCVPATLSFAVGDATIAGAPSSAQLDLRHPLYEFTVTGGSAGGASPVPTRMTSLTATLGPGTLDGGVDASALGDGGEMASATLSIIVRDGAPPTCAAGDKTSAALSGGAPSAAGTGSLANAFVSVPAGAFGRADELAVPSFTATVACGGDLTPTATPAGLTAIGPAVTFTAGAPLDQLTASHSLRRELDFAIPVNPATIPGGARMRHLQVLFQGPMATGPRVVTIANPRVEQVPNADAYVLKFSSPWFGTYQAAFAPDAGTVHRKRHLTHRAVVGFSMGSGGAASFGMRHHDQFDVIAPMGGPSDWNWLLWYVEHYALGGFCPRSDPMYPNCPTVAPNLYPLNETYAHTEDWNHWWYQTGSGNGGTFARGEYTQIFTDLALMEGNPSGLNRDPSLSFFPAGPSPSDPWVTGSATNLPKGVDCRVTVDPVDGDPNNMLQQQWQQQCYASRCDPKNAWISTKSVNPKYYDRDYNPDGSLPIISFCDGGQNGISPYTDTWAPPQPGQAFPVSMALAVDLNGNGVRDMNEPILRQGHEPWDDAGSDGLFDAQEPGYNATTNPDPNQDDYDFQLNPNGTEGNHHYDMGEPFLDYGLDGVKGTPQISTVISAGPPAIYGYDYGEGDGVFTLAPGAANFYGIDPHSILHQWSSQVPAGPMTDDALLRFDVWTDGGARDLFNFAAVANHLEGAIASRRTSTGAQLRTTAFYNNFEFLPGEDPTQPKGFSPNLIRWADLVDAPSIRYGTVDATPGDILQGDGQHVGTATQLLYRLESSLYFAAQHWPDADHTQTEIASQNPETSTINELGPACETSTTAQCTANFTGPKTGRTGPVVIQLPPGYGLAENAARNVRYPVVYVLHGYGQKPQDLEAVAVVSTNFMNDGLRSAATRLGKFIIIYVDGRCRVAADGWPECIRGTFYLDSNRVDPGTGKPIAQLDSWFDELVDYIDTNYRTMGPSDIDVVE